MYDIVEYEKWILGKCIAECFLAGMWANNPEPIHSGVPLGYSSGLDKLIEAGRAIDPDFARD